MLAFGVRAADAARHLGRAGLVWFAFGAVLGPLALVLLRAAPPAFCPSCGSPTRGWLSECWWCGANVRRGSSKGPPALPELPDRAPNHQPYARSGGVQASNAAFEPTARLPAEWTGQGTSPTREPAAANVFASLPMAPANATSTPEASRVLATAVYVTGSTNLESGRRYAIAVGDGRLRILGPLDLDPSRIALDHPITGMVAQANQGRLNLGNAQGLALSFMSIGGPTTRDLVATILDAARVKADD
jgi:hypothetical protein